MNDETRDPFASGQAEEPPRDEPSDQSGETGETGSFERLPDDLKHIHASLDADEPEEGESEPASADEAGEVEETAEEPIATEEPAPAEAEETAEEPADEEAVEPEGPAPQYEGADATAILPPLAPSQQFDWVDAAPLQPQTGEGAEVAAIPGIDLGPEKRSRAWLVVLLGVLLVGLIGGFVYAWWYTTQRPVPVPNLVGKLPAQAVQSVNDAGLRLGKVSEVPTETSTPGTIISQTPLSGAKLVPGSSVSFAVATEPDSVKVPEVFGMPQDDAKVELAKQRLAAHTVEIVDPNNAVGSVSAQIPPEGTRMTPGSIVVLVISTGPAPAQLRVPRLKGLREGDAQALLKAAGLRGKGFQTQDASITAGDIMDQAPAPESFAPYDGMVHYLIAAGPGATNITVPNVVGTSEKSAKAALQAKGLKVTVSKVPNSAVAKGNVIAQTPVSGRKTGTGATVGLLVSKGSSTTGEVPDIKGMASADATAAITKAGFIPLEVKLKTTEQTAGSVVGQYPEPKVAWVLRLPVLMVVAED